MDRDRKNNRIPGGLSFLMWPALVRAPWLIGQFSDTDGLEGRNSPRREEQRRRKYDR